MGAGGRSPGCCRRLPSQPASSALPEASPREARESGLRRLGSGGRRRGWQPSSASPWLCGRSHRGHPSWPTPASVSPSVEWGGSSESGILAPPCGAVWPSGGPYPLCVSPSVKRESSRDPVACLWAEPSALVAACRGRAWREARAVGWVPQHPQPRSRHTRKAWSL